MSALQFVFKLILCYTTNYNPWFYIFLCRYYHKLCVLPRGKNRPLKNTLKTTKPKRNQIEVNPRKIPKQNLNFLWNLIMKKIFSSCYLFCLWINYQLYVFTLFWFGIWRSRYAGTRTRGPLGASSTAQTTHTVMQCKVLCLCVGDLTHLELLLRWNGCGRESLWKKLCTLWVFVPCWHNFQSE